MSVQPVMETSSMPMRDNSEYARANTLSRQGSFGLSEDELQSGKPKAGEDQLLKSIDGEDSEVVVKKGIIVIIV